MSSKTFFWVIKNFSSLQSETVHSDPVHIGDCKWHLAVYPTKYDSDYLDMGLEVVDFKSILFGWKRNLKLKVTIINQLWEKRSVVKEKHLSFDEKINWSWMGFLIMVPFRDQKQGFLINGKLKIAAEIQVLEVIGPLDESEEFDDEPVDTEEGSELMKRDDGEKSVLISKQVEEERMDVNGFQVLPSQVESVRRLFEKHPDIAVGFRAKNQLLRTTCMSFLLSLIETMCQSLEKLSNEDLVEADIALTYLKDAGFKVDWLELKLDQVKENKEKEQLGLARLHEIEDSILKLKQKCSEMDALAEKEKEDLSATRAPLSFDDLV